MKRILLSTLLVLLSFSLFAGGKSDSEVQNDSGTVNLRFTTWTSNETQLDLFRSMVDDFNNSQDEFDITVDFDSIPFGDYVQKITLQLSGSNPPDCGWLVESSAPTFVNAGVLNNITEELQAYNFEDFSRGAMTLWEKDSAVYGVPFSTSPFLIIYNKTMMEEAGVETPSALAAKGEWTWEKFREISSTIKSELDVYAYQGTDGLPYTTRVWHNMIPMIRAYGADAWDQDGNVTINSPEAVQAVELYHDMIFQDESVVPPGDLSDFYAGNAAMTMGQISRVSKLKDVDWEWDIAPLPTGPAGEGASYTIGQAAIVSFGASKNQAASKAFVAFMTNEENVAKMAQYWPPARQSVASSEAFIQSNALISEASMASAVVPGLAYGKVLPYHERYPQISLSAQGEWDQLWRADADVPAILDSLAEVIKAQM